MKEEAPKGLRGEWKKIRSLSGKEAMSYLWDYYRLPVILIACAAALVISVVTAVVSNVKHPYRLNCCVTNSFGDGAVTGLQEAAAALFPESDRISVADVGTVANEMDTTANVQLMTYVAANQIDLLLCDRATLDYLSESALMPMDDIPGMTEENGVYYAVDGQQVLCAADVTDTGYGRTVGATEENPIYLALFEGTGHEEDERTMAAWLLAS